MEHESRKNLCDWCGKEAHRNQDGSLVPLKRCTRCRKAFYHDIHCQKKHFREHRITCRPPTFADNEAFTGFVIQQRPGRGKCVVAKRPLPTDYAIGINNHDSPRGFRPLVLPVLNRSCRTERCAHCFVILGASPVQVCQHPLYPVLVCSLNCQQAATNHWFLAQEVECVVALYRANAGPPTLLPMALLVFRLVLALAQDKLSWQQVDSMQIHNVSLSQDALIHQQAVIQTVQALAHVSSSIHNHQNKLQSFSSPTIIRQLWSAIKYNAFTVTDNNNNNNNNTPLGIGLYQTAHCLNHSCRPNAVQSFHFFHEPPQLQIHLLRPVAEGEEICIRYNVDTPGQSRDERRRELHEQYNFGCECELCRDV